MVSYASGSKTTPSSTIMNLPWPKVRGLMESANQRFVEPFLKGDWSAPAIKDMVNLAGNQATKTSNQLIGQLAGERGISAPAKAKMANDSMSKILELSVGAGVNTIQGLASWFDKVTGQMASVGGQTKQGSGGGVSYSGQGLGGGTPSTPGRAE